MRVFNRHFLCLALLAGLLAGCGEALPGQRELEMGVRELKRGNTTRARELLQKSIAARPGSEQNLEAWNFLGIACWKLGKTQEAMEAFENARRLSPLTPEPTYNLGVLCAENNDTAHALQLLKEAALMDEKDPRPLEYMGSLYAARRQWPEARRSYYAARSRAPESPRILTAIALIELETEKPETAVATLQSALGHDRDYAPALFNLGVILQSRLQDTEHAREHFRRYLRLETAGPQADYARKVLAVAAPAPAATAPRTTTPPVVPAAVTPPRPDPAPIATGPRAAPGSLPAAPVASTVPAPAPAPVDPLQQARAAADAGRMEESLNLCLAVAAQAAARGDKAGQERALRGATQLYVDSARAHTLLGDFLFAQGRGDDALTAYKAAMSLDSSYAPAALGAGKAATVTREFDTALVGLKQAVRSDPTNADALWLLAQLYDRQLDLPVQARSTYADFTKLFAGDARAAQAATRLRALGGAPSASVSAPLRRPPATAPSQAAQTAPAPVTAEPERVPEPVPSAPATRTSIVIRVDTPAPEQANPDLIRTPAAAGAVNPTAARQAMVRASSYQQRGDWNNAIAFFEQAVKQDATLSDAWYNLGVGYSLRGDGTRAKDAYLRVLERRPDHVESRYNLALLYQEAGDTAAAEKTLQDLAQRKPDFPNTYLALGQLYARNAATLPQARAAYQQFLKVAPNDPNAAAVRQWLQRQ